jgi:hypothetical protein
MHSTEVLAMKRRICTLVAMCAVTAQLIDAQSIRWIDMPEQPTPRQYYPFYATVVLDEWNGTNLTFLASVHNLSGSQYIPSRFLGFLGFGGGSYSIPVQWRPDWVFGFLTETSGYLGLNRETLVFDGTKIPQSPDYILVGSANFRPAYYTGSGMSYARSTTISVPSSYPLGRALGISTNAQHIAGFLSDNNRSTVVPFYHSRQTNSTTLLSLPSGLPRGMAVDVSDTGVIVGEAYTSATLNGTPVRWQNSISTPQILSMPSGHTRARVLRVSNDGRFTLGITQSNSEAAVVIWDFTTPLVIYTTRNFAVEADMNPTGSEVYILDNRRIFHYIYGNNARLYADYTTIYDDMYGLRLSSTTGRTASVVTMKQGKLSTAFVVGILTSDIETYFYSIPTAVSSDGKFMLVQQRFNLDHHSPSRSYVVDTNYDNSDTGRGIDLHPLEGGYAYDISDKGRYNHRIISGAYAHLDRYKPIVYEVTSPPLQLTRIVTDAPPVPQHPPLSITTDGTVFVTRAFGANNSYLWTFDGSEYRVSAPFNNISFYEISGNGRYVVGTDHNMGGRMTIYDRQANTFSTYSVSANHFYITDNRKVVFNNSNDLIVWSPSSSTTFTNCWVAGNNPISMDGRWIVGIRVSPREGVLIDTQTNTVHSMDTYFSSILCHRCSLNNPYAISKNGRYIVGVGTKDGEPTFYLLDMIGCRAHDGDVNEDRCVDDADLLQILFSFGSSGSSLGRVDVNCDEVVDDADLLIVLFNFGSGC